MDWWSGVAVFGKRVSDIGDSNVVERSTFSNFVCDTMVDIRIRLAR